MDAYATSAIIGVFAALIALVSFYYKGKAKFYAYGVPFVTVCTAFLITADACNQQPTCEGWDGGRVRRMREFIRCRLAYSGICQDYALWLLYVKPMDVDKQSGTEYIKAWRWCFAYASLAGLEGIVYIANSSGTSYQYWTAGIGTAYNIIFFFWVLQTRLWGKFALLFKGNHHKGSNAVKCAVVCVVMFAYIFAVGVVLRDVGPNLSALVSCISPLSFITVPLCIGIFGNKSLPFFRRKMQGVLIAITINNVFFYWALYAFTYVDASLADYRAPYLWPPVLLVAFGLLTVLFIWRLEVKYITDTSRDEFELARLRSAGTTPALKL